MSTLDVEHPLWPEVAKWDARRPRSSQEKLGCSELGGCRRKAAYRMFKVAPSDPPREKRAAALGTWIHAGAEEVMVEAYGAINEVKIENDLLKSASDLYFSQQWLVEDIKTCRDEMMLGRYMERGPTREHRWQVHKYADMIRRGEFQTGPYGERRLAGPQPVTDVRIRYIARSSGDEWPFQEPFDPDVVAEADEWLAGVMAYQSAEEAPRDEPGPGVSYICDSCPFRTACWGGSVAGAAPQSNLVVSDADVADALRGYEEARAVESDAKKEKAFWRAKLDASEPGVYNDDGVKRKLSWTSKDEDQVPDPVAMQRLLEKAGVDVPMKTKKASKSITVRTVT